MLIYVEFIRNSILRGFGVLGFWGFGVGRLLHAVIKFGHLLDRGLRAERHGQNAHCGERATGLYQFNCAVDITSRNDKRRNTAGADPKRR